MAKHGKAGSAAALKLFNAAKQHVAPSQMTPHAAAGVGKKPKQGAIKDKIKLHGGY